MFQMPLLDRYVDQTEFDSYDAFRDGFRVRIPDDFNFSVDVVDVYAREEPEKRALVWCDDHGRERTFTFRELAETSRRTAVFFRQLGIGKGDAVMLVLRGRYEFWWCMLALHRLGAVAIPATHMLKSHDLAYRFDRADVRAVVCVETGDLLDQVERAVAEVGPGLRHKVIVGGAHSGWISVDEGVSAISEVGEPAAAAVTCRDTMLLYFTSGTTGFPKMVAHTFGYPLGHILTARYWQNVEDDGLHYTVADTGWAKAVWGKIYGQWLAGSAVFVYDYNRFSAPAVLHKAVEYGVTTFCAPPTVYRFLVKEDLRAYRNSSLRYCVVAGEPLNPEVYHAFLSATGIRLMEGYGQTELTVTIATWPWMEPKPGSMGKPSPGYSVDLVNPDGMSCRPGEEGEIVIDTGDGPPAGMFAGYHQDPELTRSVWYDGRYHTGDIACRDADGYFWFVGRVDDVIKSAGYRIGPFEVESALMQHPGVLECAVTGVPDPVRGQLVKATVVPAPGWEPSDVLRHELQQHVKTVTAPYKYPRVLEFVSTLPKTISGKIRRTEIRERDGNRRVSLRSDTDGGVPASESRSRQ
jgi:acetyl-CoA synthetase